MPSIGTFVDEPTAKKVEEILSKSDAKSKSAFLKDLIEKEIDRFEGRESRAREHEGEPARRARPRETRINMANRIKGAIADAVELRAFTQALGIDITQNRQQQQPWYPWMPPYTMQQPPQKAEAKLSTKDMLDQITLIRMVDNMATKETDTETKSILSDIKQTLATQLSQNQFLQQVQRQQKDPTKELMDRIVLLRSLGMTDEAKGLQSQLIGLMQAQMQKSDQDTQAMSAQIHGLQQAIHQQDLARMQAEIEKIKNRPTELDKIRELSELAQKDPAVKAYMKERLGVKAGGFNVKDLGEAFRNMNINVGDFIDALSGALRKIGGAPMREVPLPAPPAPTPKSAVEEEGLPPQMVPPEALEKLRIEGAPTETVEIEGLGPRKIPPKPEETETRILGERPPLKKTEEPKTKKTPKSKKTPKPKGRKKK